MIEDSLQTVQELYSKKKFIELGLSNFSAWYAILRESEEDMNSREVGRKVG